MNVLAPGVEFEPTISRKLKTAQVSDPLDRSDTFFYR